MSGARKRILVTSLVLLTLGTPYMKVAGEMPPRSHTGKSKAGTYCEANGCGVGLCARTSSRLPRALSLLGLCVVLSVARPASLPSS